MAKSISDMNVYERVLGVMSELGMVKKDGNVSFNKTNYNYVSEAAFIAALRPLMIRYRLIIFPSSTQVDTTTSKLTRIQSVYTVAAVDYEGASDNLMHIETGGEGADSFDKGIYKAMTGAFKYALRQTFMVATGDDAEATDGNGNKTNGAPTPFEALRKNLEKAGIAVDKALAWDKQESAFAMPDRKAFVGGALAYWLRKAQININGSDHDTMRYAVAIKTYISAVMKASTFAQVTDATQDLCDTLEVEMA